MLLGVKVGTALSATPWSHPEFGLPRTTVSPLA
jgi:hypothetical protein